MLFIKTVLHLGLHEEIIEKILNRNCHFAKSLKTIYYK